MKISKARLREIIKEELLNEGAFSDEDIGAVEQGTGPYTPSLQDLRGPVLTGNIEGPTDYKIYTRDGHHMGTIKINPDNELLDLETLQKSLETLMDDGFDVERVEASPPPEVSAQETT